MIRILNFIANLPGIRYLLARSASRRQEAVKITLIEYASKPEQISLCYALAECHTEIARQKNRIERLEQLARDLDAKLTEDEAKDLTMYFNESTWKPCPFCGSQDIDRIKAMAMYTVVCNKCEVHSPWFHTMEEAWHAWNMREARKPEDLRSKLAEREIELTLQKNTIERLEQLARDLDAKLTESEAKDLTP